jgi:hypothetical protein
MPQVIFENKVAFGRVIRSNYFVPQGRQNNGKANYSRLDRLRRNSLQVLLGAER